MKGELKGIYGITSKDFGITHEECARIFLEGGIRIVQYREKAADTKTMIADAKRIKELCSSYNALFIVDDRIDVAIAAESDGVHLGQDDAPIELARDLLPGRIIGASAKTPEQAGDAEMAGASYLGAGAIFATSTKVKTRVIGFDGFKAVRKSTGLPVFGVGGLKLEHIKELKGCGADGAAVITAVLGAKDPVRAAKILVDEWGKS